MSKEKVRLARSAIYLALQGLSSSILGIIYFAFIARLLLEISDLGKIVSISMFSELLITFTTFSISSAIIKYFSESIGKANEEEKYGVIINGFRFLLSSSVANKAYIYGNIIFQVGGREIPYRYKLVKKNELLKEFVIPHSGSIISAKLFRSGGLYEKKYKIIGDHAWVVKVHDLIHLVHIDFFQCKMKLGGTSNNPKTVKKILDEVKIMEKEHSIRINLSFKFKKYLALIASYLGAYEKLQVVWWLMRSIRR